MDLKRWFNQFEEETGERIEDILLSVGYMYPGEQNFWLQWFENNKIIKFSDISEEMLNHRFDDGFGGKESPHFVGYSKNWIMISTEYDGSESWDKIPREPRDYDGWAS